jgi:hypothetical protein
LLVAAAVYVPAAMRSARLEAARLFFRVHCCEVITGQQWRASNVL